MWRWISSNARTAAAACNPIRSALSRRFIPTSASSDVRRAQTAATPTAQQQQPMRKWQTVGRSTPSQSVAATAAVTGAATPAPAPLPLSTPTPPIPAGSGGGGGGVSATTNAVTGSQPLNGVRFRQRGMRCGGILIGVCFDVWMNGSSKVICRSNTCRIYWYVDCCS